MTHATLIPEPTREKLVNEDRGHGSPRVNMVRSVQLVWTVLPHRTLSVPWGLYVHTSNVLAQLKLKVRTVSLHLTFHDLYYVSAVLVTSLFRFRMNTVPALSK